VEHILNLYPLVSLWLVVSVGRSSNISVLTLGLDRQTAKCSKYFTIRENGLKQDWSNDVVFMNPPFGREIGKWMQKAYRESLDGATVVCLIPSRTDTAWWHDYAVKGQILFLRGRVKFVRNGKAAPAPFPSAIVAFGSNAAALRKALSALGIGAESSSNCFPTTEIPSPRPFLTTLTNQRRL
jgi:site-specific DNA-methyltransferase (adenine-specific)